jgi:peptidoglycan/LPS O-acetylase OafA/YrhL
MATIGQLEGGRRNNFDCARFSLAALVIYSHAFPLLTGEERFEPLKRLSRGHLTLGQLAVGFFFAISGFLITQSWASTKSLVPFFIKRVLRIYPAFIVASLFSLLVVAPIASWDSLHVTSRDVLGSIYRLLVMGVPSVPGVFLHNPYPNALNGSMWTIRYEFCCYILTAVLGMVGLLENRSLLIAVTVAALGVQAASSLDLLGALPLFHVAMVKVAVQCVGFYMVGVLAYVYRDQIPISGALAVGCAALLFVLAVATSWSADSSERVADLLGGLFTPALATLGVYVLYWFAFSPKVPLQRFGKYGDFSYGVYVYAFPIEQLLALFLGKHLQPWSMFVVGLAITLVFAVLSWHLVERPCLKLKPASASFRREPAVQV